MQLAPSTASSTGPVVSEPTADPAAQEALPLLVRQQGAQTSALAPAVGQDSPDLAVLARTGEDEASTEITFWAWDGGTFRPDGSLTAHAPLLAQREGGAAEWHYLTAGYYPDAAVYVQGGTLSGGVQAVVARHTDDGRWELVPFQREDSGVDPAQDVYADDPLFDEGRTFVTRGRAGGEVSATWWRYVDLDGRNAFEQSPEPDPDATAG